MRHNVVVNGLNFRKSAEIIVGFVHNNKKKKKSAVQPVQRRAWRYLNREALDKLLGVGDDGDQKRPSNGSLTHYFSVRFILEDTFSSALHLFT